MQHLDYQYEIFWHRVRNRVCVLPQQAPDLNPIDSKSKKPVMKQQWFVLCTQNNQEKKVMQQLSRKGLEHFCPFSIREEKVVSRTVKAYAPLFPNQVFVLTEPEQLTALTRLPGVVSVLYWKAQPAVISEDEINAIRMMTENYVTLQVEKAAVNPAEKIRIIEKSISGYNNQVLSIRHQGLSVQLPSLGRKLVASREQAVTEKAIKVPASRSFAQRLNPLALFGF